MVEGLAVREAAFDVFRSVVTGAGGETIRAPFPEYVEKPVEMAFEVFGVRHLTDEQIEIMLSFQEQRETNVAAGISVGKTFVAALLLLWWVYAVGGRAITTAPRDSQVILIWEEIYELWKRVAWKVGGECLTHSLKLNGRVRAYGYVASKHAEESFGGRHDPYLAAFIDEASGMGKNAEDGITANLTDYTNRLLRIGNPLAGGTIFHNACKRSSIEVSIWTHPNVSWAYGPGGMMRKKVAAEILNPYGQVMDRREWPEKYRQLAARIPGGPSVEVIEDRRVDDGRCPGTVWWTSRHNAKFPEDAEKALVPRSWFIEARARYDEDPAFWKQKKLGNIQTFGVDIGDGKDPHAIAERFGPLISSLEYVQSAGVRLPLVQIKTEMKRRLKGNPGSRAQFDATGVGSGPSQEMAAAGYEARAIKVGENAADPELYYDDKAERFWHIRKKFQDGVFAIAPLPENIEERLREELAEIRWELTPKGQYRLEPKKETKKRLGGRSYDLADALALTEDIPLPEDEPGHNYEQIEEGALF